MDVYFRSVFKQNETDLEAQGTARPSPLFDVYSMISIFTRSPEKMAKNWLKMVKMIEN